jgi:hypothetical protein
MVKLGLPGAGPILMENVHVYLIFCRESTNQKHLHLGPQTIGFFDNYSGDVATFQLHGMDPLTMEDLFS